MNCGLRNEYEGDLGSKYIAWTAVKIGPEINSGLYAMTSVIPVQRSTTELIGQLGAGNYVGFK